MLVSQRYRVQPSQIVELAPFLFFWAAEASLRHRRDAIDQVASVRADLISRGQDIPHVFGTYDLWEEDLEEMLIASERASIEMGDIFGQFASEEAQWGDDVNDPFSAFLGDLVKDFGEEAEFSGFDWADGTPDYRVCVEYAEQLADGDQTLADVILRGYVALHEMPRDLREDLAHFGRTLEEVKKERVEWIRANLREYVKELENEPSKLKPVSDKSKRSAAKEE